jgi:hypothetical protein
LRRWLRLPSCQGKAAARRQLTSKRLDRNHNTGGKARWSPAARLLVEARQPLEIEALSPLADDLARHAQTCSDAVVAKHLTRHEHDLGPHDITVR